MHKPLISIIMPVYNTLDYLLKGIDSALNQSYKNIELIIINDGSTDGSDHLIDKICDKNPNVKVYHQKNAGVSAARNKGLDLVKGEYLCFLDSDDWLTYDAIEFLYELIVDTDNVISACDRNFVQIRNDNYIIERQRKIEPKLYLSAFDALLETGTGRLNLQSACYKLFPTKLINGNVKIRFHEEISHGEDGLFVFDVMNKAKGIIFSTEPKWNIVERNDSATNSGYTPKMKSALNAVDIMIDKSKNSNKLQNALKVYYTKRAMGLVTIYIISKYKDRKELRKLRVFLTKYNKEYLKSNVGIYNITKYYTLKNLPCGLINILYKLNQKITEN